MVGRARQNGLRISCGAHPPERQLPAPFDEVTAGARWTHRRLATATTTNASRRQLDPRVSGTVAPVSAGMFLRVNDGDRSRSESTIDRRLESAGNGDPRISGSVSPPGNKPYVPKLHGGRLHSGVQEDWL